MSRAIYAPAIVSLIVCTGAALITTPVKALEISASADLGAEFETNARRSSADEDVDVTLTPGITGAAYHAGPNIDLLANYHMERRIYQEDFFNDESRLTGFGNMYWRALPERLDVRFSQRRNETTRASFSRGTRDDREIISTSELAPTLRFRLRGTDELQLTYTGTYTDTDEEDIDNVRQSVGASYVYGATRQTQFILDATAGETKYDNDDVPKVEFENYTGTLSTSREQTRLTLMGGYSTYKREGEEDVNGPIGRANFTTETSYGTTIALGAERTITDRSEELLRTQARDPRRYEEFGFENSDLTDIFESTTGFVQVSHPFGPNEGFARVGWTTLDYERAPRDEDRLMLEFGVSRAIRRSIEGELSFDFADVTYDQLVDADYRHYNIEASIVWEVNPRFEAQIGAFHLWRRAALETGGYDNTGVFVNVQYFFFGRNQSDRFE